MTNLEKYRDYWSQQSLSTVPLDRPATEAAIRNMFRAANAAEPEYFLWFDSPREAAGAAHILFVEKDPERFREYWNQLIRKKRVEWERVRQLILTQTGVPDWKMLLKPQRDGPAETSYVRALRLASGRPWLHSGPRYHCFLEARGKRVQKACDRIREQQATTDPLRMLRWAFGPRNPMKNWQYGSGRSGRSGRSGLGGGFSTLLQEDVDEVTWKCFYLGALQIRPTCALLELPAPRAAL